MIRNNLFRTLQINQRLAAIYGMFSQGKQLNLSKNKGTLWHFYLPYSYPPLPNSAVALITGVCIQSGNSSLTATESGRMCLSSIKAPFPEKYHYFSYPAVPWKSPPLDRSGGSGLGVSEPGPVPRARLCLRSEPQAQGRRRGKACSENSSD